VELAPPRRISDKQRDTTGLLPSKWSSLAHSSTLQEISEAQSRAVYQRGPSQWPPRGNSLQADRTHFRPTATAKQHIYFPQRNNKYSSLKMTHGTEIFVPCASPA